MFTDDELARRIRVVEDVAADADRVAALGERLADLEARLAALDR